MKIKINKYFSDFFINGWNLNINNELEVEYVDANQFLRPERIDLVCKLFYIYCKEHNRNMDLAKKIYTEHLRAFSYGTFKEPGSNDKDSIEKYFNVFDQLINEIRERGFDAEKSVIPVGDNNSILDGSHRTAIAIYYGIKLPIVRIHGISKVYDYEFFLSRKIDKRCLDFMSFLYINFHDCCYVACIWPRADNNKKIKLAEKIIKKSCGIVYKKRIKFNYHGIEQLMVHFYGNQEWAGNVENKFKGIPFKANQCFKKFSFTTIYVLSGCSLNDIINIKAQIRDIFGINNHSIHITDTKMEAINAGQELLFQDSINILNYGRIFDKPLLVKKIIDFKDMQSDNYIITKETIKIFYDLKNHQTGKVGFEVKEFDNNEKFGYILGMKFSPISKKDLKYREKFRYCINLIHKGVMEDCLTKLNVSFRIKQIFIKILDIVGIRRSI